MEDQGVDLVIDFLRLWKMRQSDDCSRRRLILYLPSCCLHSDLPSSSTVVGKSDSIPCGCPGGPLYLVSDDAWSSLLSQSNRDGCVMKDKKDGIRFDLSGKPGGRKMSLKPEYAAKLKFRERANHVRSLSAGDLAYAITSPQSSRWTKLQRKKPSVVEVGTQ